MGDPIFCAAAFSTIYINSFGQYAPCCNLQEVGDWNDELIPIRNHILLEPKQRINSQRLVNLRKELINGVWPKVCDNCRQAEALGVQSARQFANDPFGHADIPITDNIDSAHVKHLILTFSTTCNAKCMTCGPWSSSLWDEENNTIWEGYPKHIIEKRTDRNIVNHNYALKLIKAFPNIVTITFLGGEPTISSEHQLFLKSLMRLGYSKNIHLSYNTNLTGISEELISLWDNFSGVSLGLSIDGYKLANDYIRYPFRWEKVTTNLKILCDKIFEDLMKRPQVRRYSICLSTTLSIFNADNISDLIDYYFEFNKKYTWTGIDDEEYDLNQINMCYINYLFFPTHAHVGLLRDQYRAKCIKKLQKVLTKIEKYNRERDYPVGSVSLVEGIKMIIHRLDTEKIEDTIYDESLEKAMHFISASDKFRNRNIDNFIPGLRQELEHAHKKRR